LGARLAERPVIALLGVFVIFYLLTSIKDHSMLTTQGLRGIMLLAAPLALFGGAQTVCMLTAGIDMSVSMVGTLAAYFVIAQMNHGVVLAVIVGLLVGALAGAINGIGVGVFRVSAIIMTLGMQAVLLGLATVGSGAGGFLTTTHTLPGILTTLGGRAFGFIPYGTMLLAVLAVLIILGLSRTGLGRNLYAIGDNEVASRLAGVRVWQVIIATYIIAGVLSAIAGFLIAGQNGTASPNMGNVYLLPSVAAAVIGGTSVLGGEGGFSGTIVGAFILTVLNRLLLALNVNDAMQQFVYGLIVLALAWIYSRLTGVRGSRSTGV